MVDNVCSICKCMSAIDAPRKLKPASFDRFEPVGVAAPHDCCFKTGIYTVAITNASQSDEVFIRWSAPLFVSSSILYLSPTRSWLAAAAVRGADSTEAKREWSCEGQDVSEHWTWHDDLTLRKTGRHKLVNSRTIVYMTWLWPNCIMHRKNIYACYKMKRMILWKNTRQLGIWKQV